MGVFVLGDVRIAARGAPVRVTNARQQRIVAALLMAGPSGLSVDQLADRVWDADEHPASPVPTLRTYVKRLRAKASDPDGDLVGTRPGGYVLRVAPDEVDAARFASLVQRAEAEIDPDRALRLLDAALTEWTGAPYADLADVDWVQPEVARLHEVRLIALEQRLALQLDLGRGDVAAQAAEVLAEHPYREHLRALRVLALYRAGRQAEALADLAAHRERMADDLGVEMSAELRDLQVAILRQDDGLGAAVDGRRRLRGYRVGRQIGAGAFSVVYRATQPSVGREVAIKIIRRELANDRAFVRRFAAEAQTVARLAHPNIVPLHDFWREDEQAFLVMRWVEGGNLDVALAEGPWEPTRMAQVVGEIADALDFAHRRGVVHRDVKPSNVLLDGDGHAYLTDFGIALVDSVEAGGHLPRSVGSPTYAAPEQFDGGEVGPAADVYSLGVLLFVLASGRPPWPDADTQTLSQRHHLDPIPPIAGGRGDLDAALDAVVARATAKRPGDRYASAAALAADLAAAVAVAPPPRTADVTNPYRGLDAFAEPDRHLFHGRERLVGTAMERLADEPGLLLVGPSGCGKSSLLHAGVVPRLRAAPHPTLVATMVPGADPVSALVQALEMVATGEDVDVDTMVRSGLPLPAVCAALSPGSRVVVVVDQLEELFTHCDPAEAERFLGQVATVLSARDPSCRVVLALRADFFDRPLDSPSLGGLLASVLQVVTPMADDELVAAIVEPARTVGVGVSEPLVARLLTDVAGESGSLPLLQFALTRMFDERAHDRLDVDDYERVGGLAGALVDTAEAQLAQMSAGEQRAVRRVVSRLVAVGDEVTRRRERLAEVAALPGVGRDVLDRLVAARLLTLDRQPTSREPTVELVHEALLDAWPRMREWVAQDRDRLAVASRVRADAAEWERTGHDSSLLYRGRVLTAAEGLLDDPVVTLSPGERDFVAQALASRQADEEEERRRVQAALRQARRRRSLLAATTMAVVVGLVATLLGVSAAQRATAERELAAYTELVGTSRSLQDTRTDLALLLAVEAYVQRPTPEAQTALLGALRQMEGTVEVWSEPRFEVGTSDGACASTPEPGMLVVQPNPFNDFGPAPGGELLELDLAAQQVVNRIADQPLACEVFRAPDVLAPGAGDPRYAGETVDEEVVVLDGEGTTVATLPGWTGPFWSPDGELVARRRASDEGDPSRPPTATPYFVIDVEQAAPVGEPLFTAEAAWASTTGPFVVAIGVPGPDGSPGTGVELWDADTWQRVARLGDVWPTSPAAWSRDGDLVAFGDEDGTLTVWSTESGEAVLELPDTNAILAALSPDASMLASYGRSGRVEIRSFPDGGRIDEIDPGQQVLMRMEWVDGERLAVLGGGGVVSYLSLAGGGLEERAAPCCSAQEFSYAVPDGTPNPYAYYGDYETGQGRFVDLATGDEASVDMGPFVFDPWAAEGRLPTREAFLLKPDGSMLLVDDTGALVAEGSWPVEHAFDDDVPSFARVVGAGSEPSVQFALLGVPTGERGTIEAIELARVDGATLQTVAPPTRIDLPEPASYAVVREGDLVAIEFRGEDETRYEFRDTDGVLLADVTPPAPVGWAALTGDRRYVVAARSSDDSLRVIDTETGETTVLPVNAEPAGPQMLSDSRFLLQTREGQYEMWDAAGPTRIGALADPGPYSFTGPAVSPDETEVWLIVDEAWTRIPLEPQQWLARACALAGRSLTEREWRDFVPGDDPYRDACAASAPSSS